MSAKEVPQEKPMGQIALWLAALAILILAGAYWVVKSDKITTSNQPQAPKQEVTKLTPIKNPKPSPVVTVTYTDGVFAPANLTTKIDTTVLFKSSDATQFHLTSSEPGFDSGADTGQYAFTFSKAGTYSYHNADNPPQAGQITVTP
jgi:plastocyanin